MADLSVCALSSGTLRASLPVSRKLLERSLCAVGNRVPQFRLIVAPRPARSETKFSTICLHGRGPESRRRFIRSLSSLQLTGTSKDTVASLRSRFSAQNGFSLRPTLRFASLKSSSSSSSGRSNAAGSLRICASSATVEENESESESESKSIEAYVKSVMPGGFAAARLWGTGRRKCAIARVVLVDGTGKIIINNRTAQDYLQGNPLWLQAVKYPLASLGYESKYDTIVRTHGGGLSGQAQAILLGIARALIKANQANRDPLKKQGLLTRDSRVVERKKYGLKKARKAPQFSKR